MKRKANQSGGFSILEILMIVVVVASCAAVAYAYTASPNTWSKIQVDGKVNGVVVTPGPSYDVANADIFEMIPKSGEVLVKIRKPSTKADAPKGSESRRVIWGVKVGDNVLEVKTQDGKTKSETSKEIEAKEQTKKKKFFGLLG